MLAFIFPGQGSQYVGMGKNLYEKYDIAKEMFKKANEVVGYDLMKMCFEGPEEELKKTKYTQPAIFLVSAIAYTILKEKYNIYPQIVLGHSLGEYVALYASGALTFEEALDLVQKRGNYMYEIKNGTMLACLGMKPEKIQEVIDNSGLDKVWISLYNSKLQTVLSGEKEQLEKIAPLLKEAGAKRAIVLKVSGPFHCPLMQPAADKLREAIESKNFKEPKIEIVPNVVAKGTKDIEIIKKALINQMIYPVKWVQSIEFTKEAGYTDYIEAGAGNVLAGILRGIDKKLKVYSYPDKVSVEELKDLFGQKEASL